MSALLRFCRTLGGHSSRLLVSYIIFANKNSNSSSNLYNHHNLSQIIAPKACEGSCWQADSWNFLCLRRLVAVHLSVVLFSFSRVTSPPCPPKLSGIAFSHQCQRGRVVAAVPGPSAKKKSLEAVLTVAFFPARVDWTRGAGGAGLRNIAGGVQETDVPTYLCEVSASRMGLTKSLTLLRESNLQGGQWGSEDYRLPVFSTILSTNYRLFNTLSTTFIDN